MKKEIKTTRSIALYPATILRAETIATKRDWSLSKLIEVLINEAHDRQSPRKAIDFHLLRDSSKFDDI